MSRENPRQPEQIPDPPQGPYESWSQEDKAKWGGTVLNNFYMKVRIDPPLIEPDSSPSYFKRTLRENYKHWREKRDPVEEGFSEKRAGQTEHEFNLSVHQALIEAGVDLVLLKEMYNRFRENRTSQNLAEINVMLAPAARKLLSQGYLLRDLWS